jgi:predicted lipid-binding transport protein (Tim44 family)
MSLTSQFCFVPRAAARRAGLLALCLAVTAGSLALPESAQAKRLGAGKSQGMQRNMPARTAPDAPPASPANAAPNAATAPTAAPAPATAAAPAAAGAAAAGKRSWLGPLAGLAAGLGIAALASHLGFGEGLANLLTVLLVAAVAFFALRFLLARFARGAVRQPALAGAGAASPAAAPVFERSAPSMPARTADARAAAPLAKPVTAAFVPAAFDSEAFERIAKTIFIRLQAANDSANLDDLRRFTTPEMYAALKLEILERGPGEQRTEVQRVDARVVDVASEGDRQVVSVRYTGAVVEAEGGAPTSFDEVWHLVRQGDGEGWAIAGIEQMA